MPGRQKKPGRRWPCSSTKFHHPPSKTRSTVTRSNREVFAIQTPIGQLEGHLIVSPCQQGTVSNKVTIVGSDAQGKKSPGELSDVGKGFAKTSTPGMSGAHQEPGVLLGSTSANNLAGMAVFPSRGRAAIREGWGLQATLSRARKMGQLVEFGLSFGKTGTAGGRPRGTREEFSITATIQVGRAWPSRIVYSPGPHAISRSSGPMGPRR